MSSGATDLKCPVCGSLLTVEARVRRDAKDAEIARLREALEWYERKLCSAADSHDAVGALDHAELIGDAGARARKALEGEATT